VACLAVFIVACGVRLLTWHETRAEVGKVQTVVTAGYKRDARFLLEGGISSLFSRMSPLATPDSLGHPPGYPVLLALIFKLRGGESDLRVQLFQIFCDALACVLLCLIVAELLSVSTALVAGLLAAVSPQLAWNSVLLLPDSLAALPILCAVYLIARATSHARAKTRPPFASMFLAGALIGVSCWLRANALLLAPLVAVFIFFTFFTEARARRLRLAASLVAGAVVVVGVLTVRNAVVFRAFVPVSLGAGQTLLEGIGDYDPDARFGIPATDIEIMRQEARAASRPDYNETLLGADGIARERQRLARGLRVIGAHPVWFASVMLRRAASMLRMERARRVSDATGVGLLQRLFITALFLPLAIVGAFLLARSRDRRTLALLLAVPAYYLCFQSVFHTEYRYTLALNFSLFALAAVALTRLGGALWQKLSKT
ncbi:MAG: Dolichyl-phosphate-mannose-protein mannosyltransferase, partial [Acidobacteriota bacterium]|nr:Dolichyl-phosphate-mannose-protein mannosyltransferase [Acidobacteriota bacterium]